MLALCRQGDGEAFEALVQKYQRRVIGLCYRHVHDYEEACDLAQDVFVQVFKRLPEFEGRSSFSTWLYRITLNASYNRQRYQHAKGRDQASSLEGWLERRELDEDQSGILAGPESQGALQQLAKAETAEQVRAALQGIEAGPRKLLELVDIEGLSYEEASGVLQVPVNTVRSRLSRARELFRKRWTALQKRLGQGKEA